MAIFRVEETMSLFPNRVLNKVKKFKTLWSKMTKGEIQNNSKEANFTPHLH